MKNSDTYTLDLSTTSYDQAKIFFRRSTNNELRCYVESMLAGCIPYSPARIALLREIAHRGDGEPMPEIVIHKRKWEAIKLFDLFWPREHIYNKMFRPDVYAGLKRSDLTLVFHI